MAHMTLQSTLNLEPSICDSAVGPGAVEIEKTPGFQAWKLQLIGPTLACQTGPLKENYGIGSKL